MDDIRAGARSGGWTAISHADWDIVTGVGITALAVAAGRAVETGRGGLVTDPYAATFVAAAASPVPLPTSLDAADPDLRPVWDAMATYMGVRSRFFDEYLGAATAAGVPQVVLLAAGLDTRAYRLRWPPGTVVFELDAPKVLSFKDEVLAFADAVPTTERLAVDADLRADWPAALRERGFDVARPTVWLVEGLLPFLPNDAKDAVFTRVHELSAPGSRLAAEHVDDVAAVVRTARFDEVRDRVGIDMAALWPDEDDYRPADWLTRHGWTVDVERSADVARRYGRTFDDSAAGAGPAGNPMGTSQLITARRGGGPIA